MKQIRIWQTSPPGWTPTFEIVPLEPPTYALVDDDDYDWLSQFQWYVVLAEGIHNPRRIITPADKFIGGKGAHSERMSKAIVERHGGIPTRIIRQLDGNPLNNQRANLKCINSNKG